MLCWSQYQSKRNDIPEYLSPWQILESFAKFSTVIENKKIFFKHYASDKQFFYLLYFANSVIL